MYSSVSWQGIQFMHDKFDAVRDRLVANLKFLKMDDIVIIVFFLISNLIEKYY